MRRSFLLAWLLASGGRYHVDGLLSLYHGDGGSDGGSTDGGPPGVTVAVWAGAVGGAENAEGDAITARLDTPGGIAVGQSGAIYVVDTGASAVMRIDPFTNAVTRLAGRPYRRGDTDATGTAARFRGPADVVAVGDTLYVVDVESNRARALALHAAGTSADVTTLAGSTYGTADGNGPSASFGSPSGITTDGTALYVADALTGLIRRVTTAGNVTTVAGKDLNGAVNAPGHTNGAGTAAQFRSPINLNVVSVAGGTTTLALLDQGNRLIRQLTVNGTGVQVSDLGGTLGDCEHADNTDSFLGSMCVTRDLVSDALGNTYFVDSSSNNVRDLYTNADATRGLGTIAGSSIHGFMNGSASTAQFNGPHGIALATDGSLLVSDSGNHAVRRIDLASGRTVTTIAATPSQSGTTDGPVPQARFSGPSALTANGSNVYVADSGNASLRKVSAALQVSTLVTLPTPACATPAGQTAPFPASPSALAVDAAGTLYFVDGVTGEIASLRNSTVTTVRPARCFTQGYVTPPEAVLGMVVSGNDLYIAIPRRTRSLTSRSIRGRRGA